METVTIISSGYEFYCPECDEFTYVADSLSDIESVVICSYCLKEYEKGDIEHCQ